MMRGDRHATEHNGVLILQTSIDLHSFEARSPTVAEPKVAHAAILEQHGVRFGHHQARARQPLELCEAGDVIAVRMRRRQDLHVGHPEAELLDTFGDLRHGVLEARVHEDVARVGRNEIRRQVVGTDPIDVADQLERRKRLTPFGVLLRRRTERHERHERRQHEQRTREHGASYCSVSATISAPFCPATETAMYCLPSIM